MNKNLAVHDIDSARPPMLTPKQKAALAALALRPESEIDYSDIPPLSDEALKNARPRRLYRPTKSATTVRVDTDVLDWLKSYGKGYQTRINAILREAMLRSATASARGDVPRGDVPSVHPVA